MNWYKDFYAGESITAQKDKIKWKILHHAGQLNIFVIAVGSNPAALLEIIPSSQLLQKYYPHEELLVIGIEKGYDNAMKLAGSIVMELYQKTGEFQVREYFQEKQKENLRKEPVWKL
ncbi:MAG: hypothetical protein RSD28_08680 [Lachnospiraceae bacterium]